MKCISLYDSIRTTPAAILVDFNQTKEHFITHCMGLHDWLRLVSLEKIFGLTKTNRRYYAEIGQFNYVYDTSVFIIEAIGQIGLIVPYSNNVVI